MQQLFLILTNMEKQATTRKAANVKNAQGFLSAKDAAVILGVSPNWLYKLAAQRALPFYKLGRRTYFKGEDIEQYINSCRVDALDLPC